MLDIAVGVKNVIVKKDNNRISNEDSTYEIGRKETQDKNRGINLAYTEIVTNDKAESWTYTLFIVNPDYTCSNLKIKIDCLSPNIIPPLCQKCFTQALGPSSNMIVFLTVGIKYDFICIVLIWA